LKTQIRHKRRLYLTPGNAWLHCRRKLVNTGICKMRCRVSIYLIVPLSILLAGAWALAHYVQP